MRIYLLSSWLWLTLSLPVAAQELVFGYSLDGSPVSSTQIIQGHPTGKVLGYCGELADYLQQQGYQLSFRELNFDQRFALFAQSLEGKAGVQCGPSSKTRTREAALNLAGANYTGAFSKPFLVTSTKLLIRKDKLDALYTNPETLRIGILKAKTGGVPVTSELIEAVFATAQFIGLANRTEAVQYLTLLAEDQRALDAYATDEVLLYNMLNVDIPLEQRANYRIEPPLQGYSREEYVLVSYNSSELVELLNTWIASSEAQAAAQALLPAPDSFTQALHWMSRSDHLATARLLFNVLLLILITLLMAGLWRWSQKRQLTRALPESTSLPNPLPIMETISTPRLDETIRSETNLTTRETEVLKFLVKGLANKDIARELDLSPRTIEAHRKNIYTKLGLHSPYALVEYARAKGLI